MSYNLVNPTTGALTKVAGSGGTLYADSPIGTITPFGGSVIPSGYLLCDGQAVSRTTYSELFTVIGTAFGVGDGSTTFNIPDLREATTKGVGLSGKSNNHYDADGVALGEFVEDRVQNGINALTINNNTGLGFTVGTYYSEPGLGIETMRSGNTTEVKAVGVNYIIKAKQVGVPADFMDAVETEIDSAFSSWDYSKDVAMSGSYSGTLRIRVKGKTIYLGISLDDAEITTGTKTFTFASIADIPISSVTILKTLVFTNGGKCLGNFSVSTATTAIMFSTYDSGGDEEGFDLRWTPIIDID